MKAIQLIKYGSSFNAFKTSEIPTPLLSEKEEVLIKVNAFGLNFADVMARKGLYRAAPDLPAVLGYEIVGKVIKVNDPENEYLIGKRVLCLTRFGGYAEFVKSKKSIIKIIPLSLSDGQALALATQYCTAFLAISSCINLNPLDTILIHSASGGVGSAITQLAKHKNLKVIGLTRSPHKVDYLKQNGVDLPIVTTENDYLSLLKSKSNYANVRAVFNSVGGKTMKKDIKLLDVTGQIVFFGISDRINQKKGFLNTLIQLLKIGKIHPAKLLLNSQTISGLNLLAIADKNPQQLINALEELISLFEENKISPSLGNQFLWNELSSAHEKFEKGELTGKVFVKVDIK